jgi:hypothetical protein
LSILHSTLFLVFYLFFTIKKLLKRLFNDQKAQARACAFYL